MRRAILLLLLPMLLTAAGCGSGGEAAPDRSVPAPVTTDAPPRTTAPPTTAPPAPTTTVYAPDTVEGEVEAAYLRSWEVFGEAIIQADPGLLSESYAGEALEVLTAQVEQLITDGQSVRLNRTFNYTATRLTPSRAAVTDIIENHSVTIDRSTGEPTEPDPNEQVLGNYTLALEDSTWKIIEIVVDSRPLD